MEGVLFTVPALVNSVHSVMTLLDDGCQSYGMIEDRVARKMELPRLRLDRPIGVEGYDKVSAEPIREVAVVESIDVGGSKTLQERVFLYVVPRLAGEHSIILGKPWRQYEQAHIIPRTKDRPEELVIGRTGIRVKNLEDVRLELNEVNGCTFANMVKVREKQKLQVFAASLADINKALAVKERTDPKTKLPKQYWEHLELFNRDQADKLPPHRYGVDHRVEIEPKADGSPQEVPWGPLYSMSREMLLVLRKELTSLLAKGFIRVSSSPAAAPVLFVKKPGGGLRFCVDYRALNLITRKDRYPLPLIRETLHQINKAKWFTKLDIIAAFNKIRIAKGDEWKTAFRTRYGLFEWLVTPFGMANAPSTFQRFINYVLREFLDDFASAYVDDVLIYTDGTRAEHEAQVKRVLAKLQEAGLQVDIDKCEFSVTRTKYLGFIIDAEQGLMMDPEKVRAILQWEAPTTVKGVRGFLGFANFYRDFIKDFSEIVTPLTRLTSKQATSLPFSFGKDAQNAFEYLKRAFTQAPVMMQFDTDRETVVDTDASGWAVGGSLSQYDSSGALRPVAFFSRKMTPAECNYEIHDKELLAVIACLREWPQWLKPLKQFLIRTDHRNLKYFMTPRQLTERQARWALDISEYNFLLEYRPGKLNAVADALSRRDQDVPQNGEDERIKHRMSQIFKPEQIAGKTYVAPMITRSQKGKHAEQSGTAPQEAPRQHEEETDDFVLLNEGACGSYPQPAPTNEQQPEGSPSEEVDEEVAEERLHHPRRDRGEPEVAEDLLQRRQGEAQPTQNDGQVACQGQSSELQQLWSAAQAADEAYSLLLEAVRNRQQSAPVELRHLKLSMNDFKSQRETLLWRDRFWVPDNEPLRTRILQETHDSVLTGHPGKEGMYGILSRRYFWPNMSKDIATFVRNCHSCGRNTVWRTRKQGLLRPLPIGERIWSEISMDYITELPLTGKKNKHMLVIVDRLGKGAIFIPCENLEGGTLARKFIEHYLPYHLLPTAITSDRGDQFVKGIWRHICRILKIKQRLSTAYHPETDGGNERMNQVIEEYLRHFCNYYQDDWDAYLPMAQAAVLARNAASTGMSPFFLSHGYHPRLGESIDLPEVLDNADQPARTPAEAALRVTQKLHACVEFAQSIMAFAQQRQKEIADRKRDPAPAYRVGDKVWLDLRNFKVDPARKKKLSELHQQYAVTETIGGSAYRLNTPKGAHNVFHDSMLRTVATDPLPSQRQDDLQPRPIEVDGEDEYEIEEIIDVRVIRGRGRGGPLRRQFLCQWKGYATPEWTDGWNCEDTIALDRFEEKTGRNFTTEPLAL